MWLRMSSPLRSGMLMSRISRSQRPARSASSASRPVDASPISVMLWSSSRNCRSPARTTAWSSAIRTFAIPGTSNSDCSRGIGPLIGCKLVIERLEAATQHLGGPALVPHEVAEGRLDQAALDVGETRADRNPQLRLSGHRTRRCGLGLELENLVAHDVGALDRI